MANMSDLLGVNNEEPIVVAPYILKTLPVQSDVDEGRLLYFSRGEGLLAADKVVPDLYNPTFTQSADLNRTSNPTLGVSIDSIGALAWLDNGNKLCVVEYNNTSAGSDEIAIYTVTTPYTISGLTRIEKVVVPTPGTSTFRCVDMCWGPTEDYFYIFNNNSNGIGYKYTVTNPASLVGLAYDSVSFTPPSSSGARSVLNFNDDFTKVYYVDGSNDLLELDLDTPGLIESGLSNTPTKVLDYLELVGEAPQGIMFYNGGTHFVVISPSRVVLFTTDVANSIVNPTPIREMGADFGLSSTHFAVEAAYHNGTLHIITAGTATEGIRQLDTGYDGLTNAGQYSPTISERHNFLNEGIGGFEWRENGGRFIHVRYPQNGIAGNTDIDLYTTSKPYTITNTVGSLTLSSTTTITETARPTDLYWHKNTTTKFTLFYDNQVAKTFTSGSNTPVGYVLSTSGFPAVNAANVSPDGNYILFTTPAAPNILKLQSLGTPYEPNTFTGAITDLVDVTSFALGGITGIDFFNGGAGVVIVTQDGGGFMYKLPAANDFSTLTLQRDFSADLIPYAPINEIHTFDVAGMLNFYIAGSAVGSSNNNFININTSYNGVEPLIADVSKPIGYALETGLDGEVIDVILKNAGEFDYSGALVGDELCINSSGNLQTNIDEGGIAYCIENGKFRVYENSKGLITNSLKSAINAETLSASPGTTFEIAALTGYGIIKDIQLSASGGDLTVTSIAVDTGSFTNTLTLNLIIPDGNVINIPIDQEFRDGANIDITAFSASAADLKTTVYYK